MIGYFDTIFLWCGAWPPTFSASFPAFPSENSPYSLTTPYFCTYCSLSGTSFLFSSWLILTHLSNVDPHVSSTIKPSPSYPPSPCASAFCVHISVNHLSCFFGLFEEKPGYHLVSHTWYTQYEHKKCLTQVNKFKCKVTNTGPCIAICYFWLNHGKTLHGLRSEAPIHLSLCPSPNTYYCV